MSLWDEWSTIAQAIRSAEAQEESFNYIGLVILINF